MTPEEKQQRIAELNGLISGNKNILEQGDFHARKMIVQVCEFLKTEFPNADLSIYDKYLSDPDFGEAKAQRLRNEINAAEEEIKELETTTEEETEE